MEAIRNVMDIDKNEDVLQYLKLYKMKHDSSDQSLEMIKKQLGLPQMSGVKDIEY